MNITDHVNNAKQAWQYAFSVKETRAAYRAYEVAKFYQGWINAHHLSARARRMARE